MAKIKLIITEARPKTANVPSTAGNGMMASLLPTASRFFSNKCKMVNATKQRLQMNVILEKKRIKIDGL